MNIFILLIVLTLIFIPSISASDFENVTVENDHVTAADSLSLDKNAIGTFDELNNDLNNLSPGDTYNVDKDYIFEPDWGSNGPKLIFGDYGIDISADNVTINGNGHCIDGKQKTNILKVTGNNVKIFNLTFINSKYSSFQIPIRSENCKTIVKVTEDMSPICWTGDNGLISNCIFSDNTALNGGAIKWSGDNGVITNSLFINNIATGAGGAIYIVGNNITVANTFIINSTSQLTREAIYLDRKSENFTYLNCTTNNAAFMIKGNYSGIDVDRYLKYAYYSQVGDKYLNLIPIMYTAITLGFVNLDDELATYAQYANDTGDFTFSVIRNFQEFDIQYQKNYVITNTTLNDAFESLINDNYKNNLIMTKSLNVTDKKEYESVCHCSRGIITDNAPFANMVIPDLKNLVDLTFLVRDIVYALNVFYAPGSVFESNAQWNTASGFDVVNIFGNGAKIKAKSGDRDENKWIVTAEDQVYMIYNLTAEGFNTAIDNREGYCVLNDVALNNNRMDYIRDRDDGAAILNGAVVICNNCSFANNYAKNGGAIFNQGLLVLNNCTFNGNKGYGTGDDVLNVDQGIVLVNGENIRGSKGAVTYVESISSSVSTFITTLTTIGTVIAGVGSGILATIGSGGNFAVGIAVGMSIGTVVGGVLGVGAAFAIAPRQYNLCFDRINTAGKIIYSTVLTGLFSGFIGGAIMGAYYGAQTARISENQFDPINNELKITEDIPLGDQFELNSEFWGPIRSEVRAPVENLEPQVGNPEPQVGNPEPAPNVRLEIKGFNQIDIASRAKVSNAINSERFISFDVDCYDCTCEVCGNLGEINEITFIKGFSQYSTSSFIVKYTLSNGEQMQMIFALNWKFEIVPGCPIIEPVII